ncbi:MAG: DUF4870 domain-containing protein [Propionibacteriaceae bacterium]|nr:DUF4870 domain-containing protein [Propionibacteriaceae bacterium]
MSDSKDVQDNKGMAVVAYILFFVPLLAGTHKTSPYVKFHTNQGTVLAITAIALYIVSWLFGWIPVIGWLLGLIVSISMLTLFVFAILGIIHAVNGEEKRLPIIGNIEIIK